MRDAEEAKKDTEGRTVVEKYDQILASNVWWEPEEDWGWGVDAYSIRYSTWPFGPVHFTVLAAKDDKAFDVVFGADSSSGVMLIFDMSVEHVRPHHRPFQSVIGTVGIETFIEVWVERINEAKIRDQIRERALAVEEAAEDLSYDPDLFFEKLDNLINEAHKVRNWWLSR